MTNGHLLPKEDEHQDWNITNITESNGTTTMEFSRKKNTGDAVGDNVIEPGWRRMVCAYHDSDDYNTSRSTFTKHTWEGYKAIEFIKVQYNAIQTLSTLPKEGFSVTMVPKEKAVLADYVTKPPTTDYVTKPPTTGASTQAVSIVGHFLLLVIAVIFFY